MKAKIKFDWHVDALKLGSQFMLSAELKDYPHLIVNVPERAWQHFWLEEAQKLGSEIIA